MRKRLVKAGIASERLQDEGDVDETQSESWRVTLEALPE